MILKKLAALTISGALLTAAIPAAGAETEVTKDPDFVPGQETSSFTGSSVLDVGIIALSTAILSKLATDNIPVLRAELDKISQQVGLAGSSGSSVDNRMNGGLDFDLERMARTAGSEDLANQLAQIKALFGPAPAADVAPAPAQDAPGAPVQEAPAPNSDMVGPNV